MTGPLHDVRVLEVGRGRAIPLAARVLADLGAQVVKVESPEGDPTRAQAPFYVSDSGDERSALFEYLNWNKSGVVLDPGTQRSDLRRLVADSDVLLVGDDLDQLDRWGIDPEALLDEFGDLVVVTLTPFGTTGPHARWSATDLTLQAGSGLMSFSGTADREPLKRGLLQSTYETGLTAAYVAQAGVLAARSGAGGTFADISMSECMTSEMVLTVPEYTFLGALSARRPPVLDPLTSGAPLPAGDGYVTVQINPQIPPSAFIEMTGDERLADPRFVTPEGRALNAGELREIFHTALAESSPREFFVEASHRGLLTGFVQTAEQLLTCEHLASRQVYVEMPGLLDGRPWRMPALLPGLWREPGSAVRPAPALGERGTSPRDVAAVSA